MAIETVKFKFNGDTYTLTLGADGKYTAKIPAPTASSFHLEGGYYPGEVEVKDNAGNTTVVGVSHSTLGDKLKVFVQEKNKPVITIISPSSGSYVTTSKPTFKFKVVDNTVQTEGYSGVKKDSVVLTVGGVKVNSSLITWEDTDGGYIGTYTPSADLANGDCTVSVSASDNDGNAADIVNVTFEIDTLAPELIVDSPVDGTATNESQVTVSGKTDNDATIKIFLNDRDQGSATVNTDGIFSKVINLTEQGANDIKIVAKDPAGLETIKRKTIIFNTTAPDVLDVIIEPNPVDGGTTFTITVEAVALGGV